MARMIPSNVTHEEFHGSIGEERIYNALSTLPDEYVVFHSVHWNKARPSGNIVWGSPISLFSTPTADYLLSR